MDNGFNEYDNMQYQNQGYMSNNGAVNPNMNVPKKSKAPCIIGCAVALGIILFLAFIGFIFFVFVVGAEKEPISARDFSEYMEDNNYFVLDVEMDEKVYLAIDEDDEYQVVFFEFDDEKAANTLYSNSKSDLEETSERNKSHTEVSGKNYNKYTLSAGDSYSVVSRIENTVITVEADKDDKEEVNDVLKELGY